jgi:hypothetical protein
MVDVGIISGFHEDSLLTGTGNFDQQTVELNLGIREFLGRISEAAACSYQNSERTENSRVSAWVAVMSLAFLSSCVHRLEIFDY